MRGLGPQDGAQKAHSISYSSPLLPPIVPVYLRLLRPYVKQAVDKNLKTAWGKEITKEKYLN
jgi:hypothetical protein